MSNSQPVTCLPVYFFLNNNGSITIKTITMPITKIPSVEPISEVLIKSGVGVVCCATMPAVAEL